MDSDKMVPNIWFHFVLKEIEDIVGSNGLKCCLSYYKMGEFIDNFPPKDGNLVYSLKTFSKIISSLIHFAGENGFKAIMRGAGINYVQHMIEQFPMLFAVTDEGFETLAPREKFKLVYATYIDNIAKIFGSGATLEVQGDQLHMAISNCPYCFDVHTKSPICVIPMTIATTIAYHVGVGKQDISVRETECKATGGESCKFMIELS
jgi:predicted hydrocarbon binding protein